MVEVVKHILPSINKRHEHEMHGLESTGGKCLGIILSNRVLNKESGLLIPDDEIDYEEAENNDDYSDDEAESRRDPKSCLQNWMAIGI